MPGAAPTLFNSLFREQHELVRNILVTALHIRDLEQLYAEARQSGELSLTQAALKILDVELKVAAPDLRRIPSTGPVLVVSNHPFGLLDGLLLDSLLLRVRPDTRILTNSLISNLPEMQERCFPVDVFAKPGENYGSMRQVLRHLRQGSGVAIFPAGEVSHFQARKRCVTDPAWSSAAVRCASATGAPIVPVFFSGNNSFSFQLAGIIHPRLRTARLPKELMNKRGRDVEVRIGSPLKACELERFESIEQATEYLRARVYTLGHRSVDGETPSKHFGLPLTLHLPLRPRVEKIGPAINPELLKAEITALQVPVVESAELSVYTAPGHSIPNLLREIGRVREITFRTVGEGSGKAYDLDRFDPYYTHLILWNKKQRAVAGGYRLAWTDQVLKARGIDGLYTSTLFRFHPHFFQHLGTAAELGRSFICPDHQRDYAPLLLLWQAIARICARRPEAPVLFGPVSISADYPEASRELIVRFVSRHSFRPDLAELVTPRHAFRSRLTSSADLRTVGSCLEGVEDLAGPLSDIGSAAGVPVLLRQYLKLGGRVAGFNLDRKFSNALDGLLIVDLRDTNPKMLSRYMGAELTAQFLAQTRPQRSA